MIKVFIISLAAGLVSAALAQSTDTSQPMGAPRYSQGEASSRAGCAAAKYEKRDSGYEGRQSQNMAASTEGGHGACSEFEHSLYMQALAPTQMLSSNPTAAGAPLTRAAVLAELQRAMDAGELDFAYTDLGMPAVPKIKLRR